MLTLPFVAALFQGIFDALCIGKALITHNEELIELKASLNDYIDWDNSIHVIFESNTQVSTWFLSCPCFVAGSRDCIPLGFQDSWIPGI
jgi:hypothetical protein